MKSFCEMIRMNIKIYIQHKWGFLFTLFVQPVVLLINYFIFTSIYAYNGTAVIKGYEVNQMIWYYTAVHFVSIFIWNNAHQNISSKVLSGDISVDLLKPTNLYLIELADAIGLRLVGILLEFLPAVFIYSLVVFPDFISIISVLQFLVTSILSFFLYFNLGFFVGMFAFLLKRSQTINAIKDVLVNVFGGVLIPLEFYPQAIAGVLDYLPFKYIFYWPVQFFLNRHVGELSVFLRVTVIQLIWILLLFALAQVMSKSMMRRYCAVGG